MAIAVEEDADGLGLKLLEVGWLEISWGKILGKTIGRKSPREVPRCQTAPWLLIAGKPLREIARNV